MSQPTHEMIEQEFHALYIAGEYAAAIIIFHGKSSTYAVGAFN
jgi:hypothetical protein